MALGDGFKIFDNSILGLPSQDHALLVQQMQSSHAQNMQWAQAQQNASQGMPPSVMDKKQLRNERALALLTMRLGGVTGHMKLSTDDFLICHCTDETVFVFFTFNGRGGHTEEQIDIFPSDKLVTQLRLVMS